MPFIKGKSGNPSGRPKGSLNRVTQEVKNVLECALAREIELLPDHLSELSAKDRINALSKLLPYAMPRADDLAQPEKDEKSNESWKLEYWSSDELSWYIDTIKRVDERIQSGNKPG